MKNKPFKMKNPILAKAVKDGSPMQLNYGSPMKDTDFLKTVKKYGKEYLKRLVDPTGLLEKGYDAIKKKDKKRGMHIEQPPKYDDKYFGKPTGNKTTIGN